MPYDLVLDKDCPFDTLGSLCNEMVKQRLSQEYQLVGRFHDMEKYRALVGSASGQRVIYHSQHEQSLLQTMNAFTEQPEQTNGECAQNIFLQNLWVVSLYVHESLPFLLYDM